MLIPSWCLAQSCHSTINGIVHDEGNTVYFIDSVHIKNTESVFFDPNKVISTKIDKNLIKINGIQFSNSVYITTDGSIEFVNIKSLNINDVSGNNNLYTINDKLITCPNETKIDKNLVLLVETEKLDEYSNTCIINLVKIKTKPSFNSKVKRIKKVRIK
jgi:hypothetical protein